LAACAYGNLALRQFNDLDILLCKQDVPKAKELLIAEGYHLPFRLNAAQEGAYLQSLGQLPFVREDGSFVELHSGLTPRDFSFRLHAESLSERLVPVFVGGKQVLTLSPEDLLLILCVHGAKHVWACLGWICDVAELIYSHHAMDWARVLDQARMLRSERMLFLGLFLASVLLGATLPAPILQRALADPWIKPLAAQVCEQLFRRDGHLCEADGLGQALFHVRVRESWLDGVRYCLSLAVAPTLADWTLLRLPRCLSAAYYLLRAIRLAAKYTLSGRRGLGV
jgi:hypothetical protein